MSRKPPYEVDEDAIRDAMLDVPRRQHANGITPPKNETVPEQPVVVPAVRTERIEPEQSKRGPYKKRRSDDGQPYIEQFLVNDGVRSRVTTAIDRDIHKKMKRVLSMVAPEVTIVSYISNVLIHHLEQYEAEIDALYRHETEKPL